MKNFSYGFTATFLAFCLGLAITSSLGWVIGCSICAYIGYLVGSNFHG
jgi:hypothetical protein